MQFLYGAAQTRGSVRLTTYFFHGAHAALQREAVLRRAAEASNHPPAQLCQGNGVALGIELAARAGSVMVRGEAWAAVSPTGVGTYLIV